MNKTLALLLALSMPAVASVADPMLSQGRAPDSSAKSISELRASERRKIPLEVYLKASSRLKAGEPVEVTIILTNLFPAQLLLNSRMLVNHPRLQGEVAFRITNGDDKPLLIQTLVTPLTMREEDFVLLAKGESIQRTVDLSDIYGMSHKGTYKVQAIYHNEIDFVSGKRRSWKGRVWSDPIEIELN